MIKKILISFFLILLFSTNLFSYTRKYDRYFKEATEYHFGLEVSPRWIKATAIAESGLDPNAVSYCGAQGLMQFMPTTWNGQKEKEWVSLGAFNPQAAIWLGAHYMKTIWNYFVFSEHIQRKALTNASYNSGYGNILKAKKQCSKVIGCNGNVWDFNIEDNLVTKEQSKKETIGYVNHIRKYENQLLLAGEFM